LDAPPDYDWDEDELAATLAAVVSFKTSGNDGNSFRVPKTSQPSMCIVRLSGSSTLTSLKSCLRFVKQDLSIRKDTKLIRLVD
jgi:hypothetical protein